MAKYRITTKPLTEARGTDTWWYVVRLAAGDQWSAPVASGGAASEELAQTRAREAADNHNRVTSNTKTFIYEV